MTTPRQVRKALAEAGHPDVGFYRGAGYYYFSGGIANHFYEQGVYIYSIADYPIEKIMREFNDKCAEVNRYRVRPITPGPIRLTKKNPGGRSKLYVGLAGARRGEVFHSTFMPTQETHGHRYNAVVGPFRTRNAAILMAAFGNNNPHLQTVADAEYHAKHHMEEFMPIPPVVVW